MGLEGGKYGTVELASFTGAIQDASGTVIIEADTSVSVPNCGSPDYFVSQEGE